MTIASKMMQQRHDFNPYISDGLVAMWDGEWNVGWGVHDPNSNVWTNLITDQDAELKCGIPMWGDKYGIFDNKTCYELNAGDLQKFNAEYMKKSFTCECIYEATRSTIDSNGIFGDDNYAFKLRLNDYASTYSYNGNDSTLYGRTLQSRVGKGITSLYIKGDGNLIESGDIKYGSASSNTFLQVYECKVLWIGRAIQFFTGNIFSIRCYNRVLTQEELMKNYEVDKLRFRLENN